MVLSLQIGSSPNVMKMHQDRSTPCSRILYLRILSWTRLFFGVKLAFELAMQTSGHAEESFQAGAATNDITPTHFPAIIAGGFLESQSAKINDRLFVRSIVLDDGKTKIAFAIVDTCMMPVALIDEAKLLASRSSGIPVEHMMVSATHTHSAPAAMACLGTRQDKAYASGLPGKIAEAILSANNQLQPARIGWASIDDWEHTHNRRWIRKPDKMIVDPFGVANGLAHMHPGYLSLDVIGPSGPVDPTLSVVSMQTKDGRPLAVLANYSQHYFGAGAVSSDYYGLFCKHVASILNQPGDGNGPFVCALSQGTSGDLMWMDYGSPSKPVSISSYAESVARYAEKALAKIEYQDSVPLGIVEKNLTLRYRVPDEKRLEWARPIAVKIENELPKTIPEVYAMEALILHERQQTELKVQAIRIGELTIATLPNEVYALTGLKLRGRSPSTAHFNIELANGADGYIPTPEQHALGGYTTWPARTAGLEVTAETKIVDSLVGAMEEVTGKQRRVMVDEHGPYASAILEAQPQSYWRLNDEDGSTPRDAANGKSSAKLQGGFAWHLPGVGSGSGIGAQEKLTPSKFSGQNQINRALHLAGGSLTVDSDPLDKTYSLAFWFWLGEPSGASQRSGILCIGAAGETLVANQDADHQVQLELNGIASKTKWRSDDWNFVVVSREGSRLRVHVNGSSDHAIEASIEDASESRKLEFGKNLQGKLDEIAVFRRALSVSEIATFWKRSGIAEQRTRAEMRRKRDQAAVASQANPPMFPADYATSLEALEPIMAHPLHALPNGMSQSGNISFSPRTFASLQSGRLSCKSDKVRDAYSFAMWFRNELPNEARPVTAYLFSRGPNGDAQAPGDHLGISGNYRSGPIGRLMFFNGNARDQVATGSSLLPPNSWNHVVTIRDGARVRVFLNGHLEPEIDAEIDSTTIGSQEFFLGARNDQFAPLQGNIAYFCLFDRALSNAEAKQLHAFSGQPVGTPKGVATDLPSPASGPLTPEESLASIHVPIEFRVELVASEPQVIDPVAFDWDTAGKLWVVEMSDYPLGMDGRGKAGGRIRVLEDRDGDGHYEKSHLFADSLNFPTGILTWRDGILVTAAPQLLYLRDTDNDGIADQREVLFEGFNQGNQQLRLNHLRWGLDNWVYCANGGHHPNHGLQTQVKSNRNGQSYKIGSHDFRFKPDTGELELELGPSQFGRNRDAWGHWFGTQNANPLWHYVLADRYLARNPFVPTESPIQHIVRSGSPPVYPASALEKRFHSFEQSGRFTSACSGMIYGDTLLFGSSAKSHAFTCEPFHNLVQHNILSDVGVSFQSARPTKEGDFDFFASEDRWCRPVMARTGPDGALWIADMVRYMIEHPDWLPAEGKAELLPHYRLGDDMGRIYRVVPDRTIAMSDARSNVPLEKADLQQLVASLDSSNDWRRDKVQQLLIWKQDSNAGPMLERLFATSTLPQTRGQALYTLEGLGSLSSSMVMAALNDSHPRVREIAVRLAESHPEPRVVEAVSKLSKDADMKVCLQVALSLGQWRDRCAGEALVELASRFGDDPFMNSAIMSSVITHSDVFVQGLVRIGPRTLTAFRDPLLRQSVGRNDQATIATLLKHVLNAGDSEHYTALDDMLLALQSVGADLHAMSQASPQGAISPWVKELDMLLDSEMQIAKDESKNVDDRIAAAKLLCRVSKHRESGVRLLAQLLKPQVDSEMQSLAIKTMAQSGIDLVPVVLTTAWPELSPGLRSLAIDAFLSRESWTKGLLDRIEKNQIMARSVSLTQRARLLQHPVAKIAQQAKLTFSVSQNSTRKEVLNNYRQSLELPATVSQGQLVYARLCANCHRRGDIGQNVGPDLATVVNHSKEKLLTNILDPNVDIQPGYQSYTCLLESGEILAGLLVGETTNSVTIKQANGVSRSIARLEIERLQSSNLSFMPEGLESAMTPQELADLLAFLQQSIPMK